MKSSEWRHSDEKYGKRVENGTMDQMIMDDYFLTKN